MSTLNGFSIMDKIMTISTQPTQIRNVIIFSVLVNVMNDEHVDVFQFTL